MSSDARSTPSWVPPGPSPLADGANVSHAEASVSVQEMATQAAALLPNAPDASPASLGTAHGLVSVQADQTHYSDGFALFLGMRHSCAVAVCPSERSLLTAADGATYALAPDADLPPWAAALRNVVAACSDATPRSTQWHLGVTSALPASCGDSTVAALVMALLRAFAEHDDAPAFPEVAALAECIGTAYQRPFSVAPLVAAAAASPGDFILVDTATHEHIAVPVAEATALEWAVLDVETPPLHPPAFYQEKQAQAATALTHLRTHSFSDVAAFRDLEHRDLERASRAVPPALRPVVRHLVTENRRVQRHVAVLRRGDGQMVGALLRMSHASLRTHWRSTSAAVDTLVAETEAPSMDGLYGACMTERDGAILLVGRPGRLGDGLAHLHDVSVAQHGRPLRVVRPL